MGVIDIRPWPVIATDRSSCLAVSNLQERDRIEVFPAIEMVRIMRACRHLLWGQSGAPSQAVPGMLTETFAVQTATLITGISGYSLASGKAKIQLAFSSCELETPDDDWQGWGVEYFSFPAARRVLRKRNTGGLVFVLGQRVAPEDELPRAGDSARYHEETNCLSFHRPQGNGFKMLSLPLQSKNGFLAFFAKPKPGKLNGMRSIWSLAALVAGIRGTAWSQGDSPYEFHLTNRPE